MIKKILLLIVITLYLSGCSKKEEKFELFSAESFAYSMEDGWELNVTVRSKGFEQKENDNKFSARLSYYTNLQTPDGKLVNKISFGIIDKTENEKISEIPIESQIKLDSTYQTGKYKIIFYITDEPTRRRAVSWSYFELSK
ncbi:MAG: membrane lipoprotein lipid attachment site-containing protein [Melioribacteraceae bacterium]